MPTHHKRDAEQAKQWHDRLVIDHQEVIMRALSRELNGDVHNAQDLCQKTLFTAWIIALRKPSTLPAKENERVWLFTIARNHLRNHIRQAKRRQQIPVSPETLEQQMPRHQHAEARAFAHSIDPGGVLATLSRDDRLILDLKHLDGLNCQEIAKLLGIKPAAARQRLHRAQQRAAQLILSASDPSSQEPL